MSRDTIAKDFLLATRGRKINQRGETSEKDSTVYEMMHYFLPLASCLAVWGIHPAQRLAGLPDSKPAERRKNNAQHKKCERSYHTTLLDLKVLHECFIFQQKGSTASTLWPQRAHKTVPYAIV